MIQDTENGESLAIASEPEGKRLSRAESQGLGEMPPGTGVVRQPR